ncbi:MAG: flagellar assembly protein FliW [Calditrichaeota bacterium]|nr:flagellar assembly protein FliW [Calditrichota bacterium]RQV93546.1 MAG: flagellar assembly protein FliW [bacterium]RQW06479.1 MAG: flagellar assembly protein FliW [Calditrichota bacterium]
MRTNFLFSDQTEIAEENIINFPEGLIGFENLKKFALIDDKSFKPFSWLVSLERGDVAIPIVNPFLLIREYQKKFPLELLKELKENNAQYQVFCVVSKKGQNGATTLNLKGPIFIDYIKREGRQVILSADMLPVNYPLN